MPTTPTPHTTDRQRTRAMRAAAVATAWLAGESVATIAARLGMSPVTVRKLLREQPAVVAEHDRRERAAEHRRHRTQQHAAQAWSTTHRGAPLAQGAADLGIPVGELRGLLADRASLHPTPTSLAPERISDEEILTTLRSFLREAGGDVRMSTYQDLAAARDWPSLTTITLRHGTWRAALTAAGHTTPAPMRRCRTSDEQLLNHVRTYLATTPAPWTLTGLGTWLTTQPDTPSLGLVRSRLWRWPAILTRAGDRVS